MDSKIKGAAYGAISAVSYGVNPLFAKMLYADGVNTISVLVYRFAFGATILALMMLFSRQRFALTRREALVLFMLGALFALSSVTYFISFHYMDGGVAATLVFAYPVMVAIIMAVCFRERLALPTYVSILLTIGGLALLYRGGDGQPIAPLGFAIVLLSALSYALYIVAVNRSGIVMSSVKLTFYAMLICMLCIVAYSLPAGEPIVLLEGWREWGAAVGLGLIPTVISLVFMAKAIRCIGSTPTAIMGALEPVTAIVLGIVFLGEVLTVRLALGVVLILLAVLLVITGGRLQRSRVVQYVVARGRLVRRRWHWK